MFHEQRDRRDLRLLKSFATADHGEQQRVATEGTAALFARECGFLPVADLAADVSPARSESELVEVLL